MKQELIKLPNKARIVIADRETKVVSISILISGGVINETKKVSGITHMLERLMRADLIKNVSKFGGIVESVTRLENFSLTVTTTRDHMKEAIGTISNTIFDFYPKVSSLQYEKQVVLQEIEKKKTNPVAMIKSMSRKLFFKGSRLSASEVGEVKSVSQITIEDVKAHYEKLFVPENITISIVGDIADEASPIGATKFNKKVSFSLASKDDEVSKNFDDFFNDETERLDAENSLEKLLAEIDDEFDAEDDEDDNLLDRDMVNVTEKNNALPSFNRVVKFGQSNINTELPNINKTSNLSENYIAVKKPNKSIVAKDVWDSPVLPLMDKFDSSSIQGVPRTYESLHMQIVKMFYSKMMNLKSGKIHFAPYYAPKGTLFVQKYKALNQTRICISLPSAPYVANGHKYAKILELYLNSYLKSTLASRPNVYNLEVKDNAYRNNGVMTIYFAVDNEDAQIIYEEALSVLRNAKRQLVSKSEFLSTQNAYMTHVALNHETMSSLANRYNKWLSQKNQLFDLDTEYATIKNLKYEDFIYVMKNVLNFDAMSVCVLGKSRLNLDK